MEQKGELSAADAARAKRRAELLDYLEAGRNRWTAQRKAAVVSGIRAKILDRDEVLQSFGVGEGELLRWFQNFDRAGIDGLKVTRLQRLVRRYA